MTSRSLPPPNMSSSHAISRRHLLQIGGLGLAGLSLPKLLAAKSEASSPVEEARADSCIVIFLNGGPSHLDMWDMKPDQPAEIRGEFSPIASSLPGYQVSDQLPRLATQMHRATVVRSMHHSVNNSHAAAVYAALTGHDRGEQGGGAKPTDHPAPGSVLAMLRPPSERIVPFVHLPTSRRKARVVRRNLVSSAVCSGNRTIRSSC